MPLVVSPASHYRPSSKAFVERYTSAIRPHLAYSTPMDPFAPNARNYQDSSEQQRPRDFTATTSTNVMWDYMASNASPTSPPLQYSDQGRVRDDRLWSAQNGVPYPSTARQGNHSASTGPDTAWTNQNFSPNDHGLVLSPDIPSPSSGSSSYQGWDFGDSQAFPSPSSVGSHNEFFVDFEFSHTLSAENLTLPSPDRLLVPPAPSPKLSSSAPSSCLSTPAYRNTQLSDPPNEKSRDMSPSGSMDDPQNSRRRFPCIVAGCSRRFTSQYTLKVHVEAHKPKPRVSFPCTLGCSERFSRQHDRLRHEVAKHGKVCEFSCNECGRFFSSQKTLGNHKCPVAQGGTRWVNS
ncbi:C2H2-type domain-containing protein [Pleurotus pulmonarius]|nr:hypothetical protein EYR36_002140 [Pleurotus pulmonarius]